jgi:hypothetical protein
MSAWPYNMAARRILKILRTAPREAWSKIRVFVWVRSGHKFNTLSDYLIAELTPEEDRDRDDTLQAILTAIEQGDLSLLEPENTFDSSAPAAGSTNQPAGSTT